MQNLQKVVYVYNAESEHKKVPKSFSDGKGRGSKDGFATT
jgi:hypothetical protein